MLRWNNCFIYEKTSASKCLMIPFVANFLFATSSYFDILFFACPMAYILKINASSILHDRAQQTNFAAAFFTEKHKKGPILFQKWNILRE